ncbi:hypothetical protein BJ508DRAFT_311215 [Ascobolus immersus RN42]|uniref:Uncharacterized protein n=1 Tax=Ascobolus immersus RN42 TaxID=1160509 RepID=A0A3N4HWR9_ASCIM|nr:hypothetical protein BJ508DRAFT_311215 [Ascobolus immersus RN42]
MNSMLSNSSISHISALSMTPHTQLEEPKFRGSNITATSTRDLRHAQPASKIITNRIPEYPLVYLFRQSRQHRKLFTSMPVQDASPTKSDALIPIRKGVPRYFFENAVEIAKEGEALLKHPACQEISSGWKNKPVEALITEVQPRFPVGPNKTLESWLCNRVGKATDSKKLAEYRKETLQLLNEAKVHGIVERLELLTGLRGQDSSIELCYSDSEKTFANQVLEQAKVDSEGFLFLLKPDTSKMPPLLTVSHARKRGALASRKLLKEGLRALEDRVFERLQDIAPITDGDSVDTARWPADLPAIDSIELERRLSALIQLEKDGQNKGLEDSDINFFPFDREFHTLYSYCQRRAIKPDKEDRVQLNRLVESRKSADEPAVIRESEESGNDGDNGGRGGIANPVDFFNGVGVELFRHYYIWFYKELLVEVERLRHVHVVTLILEVQRYHEYLAADSNCDFEIDLLYQILHFWRVDIPRFVNGLKKNSRPTGGEFRALQDNVFPWLDMANNENTNLVDFMELTSRLVGITLKENKHSQVE